MNESRRFKSRMMMKDKDPHGHIWAGAFIVLAGVAAMIKIYVPEMGWMFSWPMLLIGLGVFIALKSKFRFGAWIALILVGGYFLIDKFFVIDADLKKLIWPLSLVTFGVAMIFRPKRNYATDGDCSGGFWGGRKEEPAPVTNAATEPLMNQATDPAASDEEVLDVVSVFSAVRRNVYSKKFRGGEIVSVFGGAEINLSQAGFTQQQITIESVQVFGGAKLIIPADWVIHNEAVAVFGGIEDKRPQPSAITTPEKILILKGFVMFGGIEIKSY